MSNSSITIENKATSVLDTTATTEAKIEKLLSKTLDTLDDKLTVQENNTKALLLSEVENLNLIIKQERGLRKLQDQDLLKLALDINEKEIELDNKIRDIRESQTLNEKELEDRILELTLETQHAQDILAENLAIETGYSKKEILDRVAALENSLISEYFREKDKEFEDKIEDKMEAFQDSKIFKILSKLGANQERMLEFYKKYQWDKEENKALENRYINKEKEEYDKFKEQKLKDRLKDLQNLEDSNTNKIDNIEDKVVELPKEAINHLQPQILKVQNDIVENIKRYESIKEAQTILEDKIEDTKDSITKETKVINENITNINKTQNIITKELADNTTKISDLNTQDKIIKKDLLNEKRDNKRFKRKTDKRIMTLRKRVIVQYVAGFAIVGLIASAINMINELLTSALRPIFMLNDKLGIGDMLREKVGDKFLSKIGIDDNVILQKKRIDEVKDKAGKFNYDKYLQDKGRAKVNVKVNKFQEVWNQKLRDPKSKVYKLSKGDKNISIEDARKEVIAEMDKAGVVDKNNWGVGSLGIKTVKGEEEEFIMHLIHGETIKAAKIQNSTVKKPQAPTASSTSSANTTKSQTNYPQSPTPSTTSTNTTTKSHNSIQNTMHTTPTPRITKDALRSL